MAREPLHSRWEFREEDEIVPGLTALTLLGGGLRYEAYLAWHERLRSLVVAKVVRPDLVEDEATLAGLQREIELLERLNHPIVVRSFGGEAGGARPHVVLEHLEGPRLSSLQRKHGPLLMEQLVALAIEISSALHYLAGEGLVHLDVKPSNIIMGGPPRLIDLSVARTLEQCARLRSPVGTKAYMAPEQAAVPSELLGPPADIWGLGATLYEAVSAERFSHDVQHRGAAGASGARSRRARRVDHGLPRARPRRPADARGAGRPAAARAAGSAKAAAVEPEAAQGLRHVPAAAPRAR